MRARNPRLRRNDPAAVRNCVGSGFVDPLITDARNATKYSSSSEKLALHLAWTNTVGRLHGYGFFSRAFVGTCSRLISSLFAPSPQWMQKLLVLSSLKSVSRLMSHSPLPTHAMLDHRVEICSHRKARSCRIVREQKTAIVPVSGREQFGESNFVFGIECTKTAYARRLDPGRCPHDNAIQTLRLALVHRSVGTAKEEQYLRDLHVCHLVQAVLLVSRFPLPT